MTTSTIIFLLLSFIGILDTGYLTFQYLRKKPLVCPFNEDCSKILATKWSMILGVRNEILGLLYYIFIFLIVFISATSPELIPNFNLWIFIITGLGFLYSLFLTLISVFIIKKYCFYCSISAFITMLLFVNSFAGYL